jgi:hypothetical protein
MFMQLRAAEVTTGVPKTGLSNLSIGSVSNLAKIVHILEQQNVDWAG